MGNKKSNNDWPAVFDLWKTLPEINRIIGVESEEGSLYISQDKSIKVAMFREGVYLSSITLKYVPRDSFYIASHDVGEAEIISRSYINAARLAVKRYCFLRGVGWSDEQLHHELEMIRYSDFRVPSTGQSLAFLFHKNIESPSCIDIVVHAFSAYKIYKDYLQKSKSFKSIKRENNDSFDDVVIKLSLYISSINPSLGAKWERAYLHQGKRAPCLSSSDSELLLNGLREYLVGLLVQDDARGDYDSPLDIEMKSLSQSINIIEKDTFSHRQNSILQIEAMEVVKNKLISVGISCRTNKEELAWVDFVAAAWGITKSQVCSVGKKVFLPSFIDSEVDEDMLDEFPDGN